MSTRRKRYIVHKRYEVIETYEVMALNADQAKDMIKADDCPVCIDTDVVKSAAHISARRKEPGEK